MLFTPPTPTLEATLPATTPVVDAHASGLGTISMARYDHPLGKAGAMSRVPIIRCSPGWLQQRRSTFFMARRYEEFGTTPWTSIKRVVRSASGWLSERVTQIFQGGRSCAFGTMRFSVRRLPTAAPVPGWFPGERSEIFPMEAMGHSVADSPEDSPSLPHYHLSVLPDEVAQWMEARPGKFIIDGTLGGGGHSEGFLKAGARVLGIDRDPDALSHARQRLASYGDRFTTWEGNFADFEETPEIKEGELADGLLLDLGVSSRQLDAAERGFSFMREGPLDMRMGPSCPRTAAEIVNTWSEAEISKLLFEFGEEPKSRRIAAAIVERRASRPFVTTLDLAACIEKAVGRQGKTHPATRSFQAIRMAVNEELESLSRALEGSARILKPGGRLLVITFHSLEDRMVKRFLRYRSTAWLDEPGWPDPRPNPHYQFRLLVKKAVPPTTKEISVNPRARSAKLRVAELLASV